MNKHYNVVVIGSGAGLKIADDAAKSGYKVAIIEKGPFGGTCVNRGCIPSKMLIYPSDLIQMIYSGKNLNIETDKVKGNFSKLVQRVTETIDTLATKIQNHYERSKMIDVYPNAGAFVDEGKILVNDQIIRGDKFYLSIGARPKIPEIDGLAKTPYLTSSEALRLDHQPQKVLIIGGGFISAELAHFYSSMGSEVEIVSRSGFLKKVDEEIRKVFLEEFQKSHTVQEFASITKVSYENNQFTVSFRGRDKKLNLTKADAVIVATGRQAWSDNIGIENTSIKTDEAGFIQVDEHLKTHAKNTWALGDCIGRHQFRHMANFEADYLLKNLLENEEAPIAYPPVPYAIFTHSQIGIVGKTELELKNEGVEIFTGVSEYKDSGMGKARQSTHGLVKLIFDQETKRLLSAHIIGDEAATMTHIPIAFIQMKATLEDLLQCVFIHPAFPEVISSAARNAKKNLYK